MTELLEIAVQRWMIKAGNDLITAQTMLRVNPPICDAVCFHSQQAVEKCLKAFLVRANIHVEKTHYLPRVIELCSSVDQDFTFLRDIAIDLTDYAVTDRYPDDWREIPVEEATAALQKAEEVMSFVSTKLRHL